MKIKSTIITPSSILKLVLSAGIIALILRHLDFDTIDNLSDHITLSSWGLALLFMALQIMLLAVRWLLFVNRSGIKISYITSLRITLASLVANLFFLTAISGLFVRIALTAQHGLSLFRSFCAALADRAMTLFALLALALVFLPGLSRYTSLATFYSVAATLSILVALAVAGCLLLYILLSKGYLHAFILSHRKIALVFHYCRALLTEPGLFMKIITASLAAQLCYFSAVYFIAQSAGHDISLMALLIVLPAITLVASLPISFGGWGVREGAFIYGLGLIGVPAEIAFLISVQIGLLSILSSILVSVPALLSGDLSRAARTARLHKSHAIAE